MWFDPPNPTSTTPVVAHVAISGSYCTPTNVDVQRHGNIISISMSFPPCARPPLPGFYDVPVNLGVVPPGVYDVVAGPDTILLGLAEGTLVVRDANPPFTITPDAGSPGDAVTIASAGACGPPCTVTFGDVASPSVTNSNGALIVEVPRLNAGVVDVRVGGRTATAAFDVTTGGVLDPAFFTPVLVPVFFSGNGALGSQWWTELAMANENDFPVISDALLFSFPCGDIASCAPTRFIPRRSTAIAFGATDTEGKLFRVGRQGASNVFFDARVRDLSRQAQDLGSELPIVREKDFRGTSFDLLNVPTDARFRVTLRLYRIDGSTPMHISIRPMFDKPLVTADLPVHSVGTLQVVTIADLVAKYPDLVGKDRIVISVDSGTPQPVAWGFVSITNNDTQRVTVISPQ